MNDKILLVDDEKNIQFVITKCLEEAGYTVVAAFDGASALSAIGRDSFSLVLLDIKLPDMDGLQVLKKIRKIVSDQRVMMITAHGTIETAVEAMKSGAVDYLQKPFTPEELRAAVKHNLGEIVTELTEQGETFDKCIAEGRKLTKQNHLDQALPFIRKAIQIEPDRPEPFNLLGALDELRDDAKAANRMYRVALALDGSYKPAISNLQRICQWKHDFAHIDFGDVTEEKLPSPL
jgi:CheY-like chemotaxis protein